MKRLILLSLLGLFTAGLYAQGVKTVDSGFYRIKNVKSGRYVTIIDDYGSLDITGAKADMGALRTFPDYDKIVSNAASVIYMYYESADRYDLQGQGIGARSLVGYPLQVQKTADGSYWAYASSNGISLYLKEVDDEFSFFSQYGEYGKLITAKMENYADKSFKFDIEPLSSSNNNNYFGIKPDVNAGGAWYKAFYAGFAFRTVSSGMKVFYVSKVDKAKQLVVYNELSSNVPAGTPVFVKCSSDQPSDNRLDFMYPSPSAIAGNLLKGTYFCTTPDEAAGPEHQKYVVYDEKTMRVLGKMSNGELGYIKAPNDYVFIENGKKYILANTSYLVVDADAPAEMKLVTKEEYEASNSVTVTAKSYTINYGDAIPTFEYEASATLTGTPSLTCTATSASPVGTYPITVGQGTVTGATVNGVNGTLTINPAPLAVTAKSYTIVETDALPTFEATYSGWKNGESESVLTKKPTLTSNAPADKAPGVYDITVGGAEAQNYTFTYTSGKLTITAAPTITVKAAAKEMVYGDAVPELTYTVEGGTLTGTPVLTTTATSKSDVGEYDITVAKGTITYPRLNLVGAKLTVKPAAVTVSAGTYTMKQNEPRPTFKATYSGWKNDDTEAVLTKEPTFATTAPADNTPGEYEVTVSGAEAKNYTFDYVAGKLVITVADAITIVATDATMVYGDKLPELTYTVSGGTVTGTPVLTCEATSKSDVGEYVIKVEKGTVDYANLVLVNGKLTITPAELTVKAEDVTREADQPNPEFTLVYSGWKNDDTESVLITKPVATTEATELSEPGTYDIVVSGGEAKNYTFKYVNGVLTVIPSSGVEALFMDKAFDIYTVQGTKVRTNVRTLEGLPAGIYVVNGRKVLVK